MEKFKAKLLKQVDDEKRANFIMSTMQKQIKKITQMACTWYNKLWQKEFDNIVSKRDKLQDINFHQIKLEVHDTYKKDEKLTTNFEHSNDEDVINKTYSDEKLIKLDDHLSFLEKVYNELKLHYNKQSVEEVLVQRVVKTTL